MKAFSVTGEIFWNNKCLMTILPLDVVYIGSGFWYFGKRKQKKVPLRKNGFLAGKRLLRRACQRKGCRGMRPVLLEMGTVEVYSYGIMLFLALSLAIFLSIREGIKRKIEERHLYELFALLIVLVIVGARIAFVMENWTYYAVQPFWQVFAFWKGGLTFPVGFLLATAGALGYCYYRRIRFLKLLDCVAPYAALGYAIARVGCFLNGCCYGKVTGIPWGIVYPDLGNVSRHPTQLYATFFLLALFIFLLYMKRHKRYHGQIFLLLAGLYGLYRFTNDFFRVGDAFLGFFTAMQVLSIVLMIVTTILLMLKRNAGRSLFKERKRRRF